MGSLLSQLRLARQASRTVNVLSHAKRKSILRDIARGLRKNKRAILRANAKDLFSFEETSPMRDRLVLNEQRIEAMAREVEGLLALPDPIGKIFDRRHRYGLEMYRKTVPLGVIGVVYESRPNVTIDVAAICLKSGNAVILKGGREAKYSYIELMRIIHQALKKNRVDKYAVQMIDPENRSLVKELITAEKYVDLVVPRGSQKFIDFVRTEASVPTLETGAGVCHIFVDESANLPASANVIFNAKTQRPSVCNALDTALIHRKIAHKFLPLMAAKLKNKNVEIFADAINYKILKKYYPRNLLKHAKPSDFGREFLDQKMSVKIVADIISAIQHINTYSSKHSEAILTNRSNHKKMFTELVDSAVVYTNASTRFSDGAIFGLGSEIGNSTQKLHARGPMGPAEMTTYKWIVKGHYIVRPD